MPVRGLTDNVRPAFPSIGQLRKGAPKDANGNRPGADLKTFRFTSDRPEVLAAFERAYGATPAVLHCYLPHASVLANFDAFQEEWVAGGLVHRCDGEMMVRWQTEDGEYSDEPQPCPYFTGEKKRTKRPLNPGCKAVGRLSIMLPDLIGAGYVGYVTLATTSLNDIVSITASLKDAAEKRGENPKGLQGIEWVLYRQEVKISTPTADGTRARRVKSLVRIEPAAEWVQFHLAKARAEALGQLPSGTPIVKVIDRSTGEIEPLDDDDDEPEEGEFTQATLSVPSSPTPAQPADPTPPAADVLHAWSKEDMTRFQAAVQGEKGLGLNNDDVKRFLGLNGDKKALFRYTVETAIARCLECRRAEIAAEEAAAVAQAAGEPRQASLAEQLSGGQ